MFDTTLSEATQEAINLGARSYCDSYTLYNGVWQFFSRSYFLDTEEKELLTQVGYYSNCMNTFTEIKRPYSKQLLGVNLDKKYRDKMSITNLVKINP